MEAYKTEDARRPRADECRPALTAAARPILTANEVIRR